MPVTLRSGFFSMAPQLKAVRRKISAGAEQLKGVENHPLVVVLANPHNSWVPLEGLMFIGALYGDPGASFGPDGDLEFRAGRNGRLHVTELDGSVHGNHPYLSAVAVLRLSFPPEVHAAALSKSQAMGNTDPITAYREAHRLVVEQGEGAARAICLDVYETVSEAAIRLPREIFAGPYDTRWGIVEPGIYGQIGGPVG